MIVAGIDVGFSGAICIMNSNKEITYAVDMPIIKTKKTELDEVAIRQYFTIGEIEHCFIEKAQSMPGQGISSTGRYMAGYGLIRGICVGLGIPYTLVHPRTWKKAMMKDMGKDKGASIVRVKQLYPNLEFARKKDHGICDAILIARYGLIHEA